MTQNPGFAAGLIRTSARAFASAVVAHLEQESPGVLASLLVTRGGRIVQTEASGHLARVEAMVPLGRTFGFLAALRSATAGQGSFQMEPEGYQPRP